MIKVLVYICVPAPEAPVTWTPHLPAGLHLWSALFSNFIGFHCWASAQWGWPRQGVYCQECVVALKLIYRTDCVALPQSIILFFWGGDALTGLSPGSLTQLLLALIDPVIMRVFTWADRKIAFVVFFARTRLFNFKRDFNARFSKDEQKRNGDKSPHEDKSWPVRSQLRVGRQRTWQVSLFVARKLSSIHWWKTNMCADFVRVLGE